MFGIKIISKKEFEHMKELVERHTSSRNETRMQFDRLKSDCASLRQQLNDQMNECRKLKDANDSLRRFKRDTLEALANIDLCSFRLKVCVSKCDTCDNEPTDCRKYIFGSHTFCVIPKQQPLKA